MADPAPEKPRLHPLDVPRFLEEPPQQWAAIFAGIGVAMMIGSHWGFPRDPSPFIEFFTFLASITVGGAYTVKGFQASRTASLTDDQKP